MRGWANAHCKLLNLRRSVPLGLLNSVHFMLKQLLLRSQLALCLCQIVLPALKVLQTHLHAGGTKP